jgi:hypothetical protein
MSNRAWTGTDHSRTLTPPAALPRAQPPQDPAQRAKLPCAKRMRSVMRGIPVKRPSPFSEACTAFLRIMSRIGANAFEHFRRAAFHRDASAI